jgi:uncharacterized radical SAM protein YgiQ
MYGTGCAAPDNGQKCRRPSCLHPKICPNLRFDDRPAVALLKKAATQQGVKTLTITSGIRHDLLALQPDYFQTLVERHVGGILKVAPEHLVDTVTCMMRKPGKEGFVRFLEKFRETTKRLGKRQTVVPYLMSGHPGCRLDDMVLLAKELQQLGIRVEQVQEFTPTPGTAATCMYYTGIDPDSGSAVYVARSDRDKILQKSVLLWHLPEEKQRVLKMLRELGRTDLLQQLDAGKTMPERGSYAGRDLRKTKKRTTR